MPRGLGDAPHIHDHADKACYIFDGELDVLVDNKVNQFNKDSFIFIPRGSVQALRVTSETARYLTTHAMPSYERVIRACETVAGEPGLPSADWRQELAPLERLQEIQADIGLRNITVPREFAY